MWLTLLLILLIDFFKFGKTYGTPTVLQNFFGFFPNSDIDSAINSPFWYFTLILFYYLIFPLVYRREKPILSILFIMVVNFIMLNINLPVSVDVLKLYKLHSLAFPLGMAFAHLDRGKFGLRINNYLNRLSPNKLLISVVRYTLIFLLAGLFLYTSIHSNIGEGVVAEQMASLITMAALIIILLLKDFQSGFLITLGKYSYEIYLIQWPILYRYDFIYKFTPAFLGTILYILFFIFIGYILNKISKKIIGITISKKV